MTLLIEHDPISVLVAARKVADFASTEGLFDNTLSQRTICQHMGAILADAALQAGLRYSTVVLPRVNQILRKHPSANTIGALVQIIESGDTGDFLQWSHHQKIARFEHMVKFLDSKGVQKVSDLRHNLKNDKFNKDIQMINGVGPKTVDYLACLVGIESIAVDRHIRTFAKRVGVDVEDYGYLKNVFCYAADLLSISRREFDSWIWQIESTKRSPQLTLAI